MTTKIDTGRVVATHGALGLVRGEENRFIELVNRHVAGDWGTIGTYDSTTVTGNERRRGPMATSNDAKLNKIAVDAGDGSRILSSYEVEGQTLWIITEGEGADRNTCILLPDEY